jgi:hypothetical protein
LAVWREGIPFFFRILNDEKGGWRERDWRKTWRRAAREMDVTGEARARRVLKVAADARTRDLPFGGAAMLTSRCSRPVLDPLFEQVEADADFSAIKAAYRAKALEHHPDKHAALDAAEQEAAAARFREIQEAFDTLKELHKSRKADD